MTNDTANLSRFQWIALFLAVAAAAGSTLCLQLVQTRVLSALYYNHLVYLTVTVALLGFGISGVVVTIVAPRIKRMEQLSAWGLLGFALSVPVSIGLASYLPVFINTSTLLVKLVLSYLLLSIPFIFSGITLASIFMVGGRLMHRLYFFDLAASAFGTLIFVLFLTPLGAEGLLWGCSLATLIGFIVLNLAFKLNKQDALLSSLALGLLMFACHGHLISDIPDCPKMGCKGQDTKVLQTRWTTITKVDVLASPDYAWQFDPKLPPMQTLRIGQDREAFTTICSANLVKTRWRMAKDNPPRINCEGINFLAKPNPEDSLVIGVGGGNDVINAVGFGAKNIVGIEINPETINLMKHEYADYALWPKLTNIELLCMDGRNYVASTKHRFDTINLSGIDTFSALSTGAYVLSENYLYTVEAIKDYLSTLKPNGILNIFRWNFRTPRESLRLCNLFLAASRENGNANPEKCVMIVGYDFGWSYRWAATLMKNEPFTQGEVKNMLAQIEGQPPIALIYLPKIFKLEEQKALEDKFFAYDHDYYLPNRNAFGQLITAKTDADRKKFEDSYPYNISPVYDDRPFFFEYHRMSELFHQAEPNDFGVRGVFVHYTLYYLFVLTSLISYLGMIVPLKIYARDGLKVDSAKFLITFFASLGVGFMFVELGVIQMLNVYLGHPMYSLGLVLAGLLFFTGLGSYLAGKQKAGLSTILKRGMLGSSAAILVWTLLMPVLIANTMGSELWVRAAITLASLIPLGLFMGIPFATGIKYLSQGKDRFIPWAWGINGLTSVMASILAILLAMRIGFKAVLVLAAVTYVAGYLASKRFVKN